MTFATADLYDDYGDKLTVLRSQFRHFGARKSFGGKVLTLKVFEDNSLVKSLLATPGEGRVLVVDGGESLRYALLGDNLAASAVKNGWSGLVIAGAIRDAALISEMDLGVYAMGTNPRKTKSRTVVTKISRLKLRVLRSKAGCGFGWTMMVQCSCLNLLPIMPASRHYLLEIRRQYSSWSRRSPGLHWHSLWLS